MRLVRRFHRAFGLPAPAVTPLRPERDEVMMRLRLISEEADEVRQELVRLAYAPSADEAHKVYLALVKELADLRYVVNACAVVFNLDLDGAYAEVHRSNMSKLDNDGRPVYRDDGKVMKGPNYAPPDMTPFVQPIIDHQEDPIT